MRRRGFSLKEVLIVTAILAVLAAVLFPVFASARKRAVMISCQGQLRNVGVALQLYRADHDGQAWLTYAGVGVSATTAGNVREPWERWLPLEYYIKSPWGVRCPATHFKKGGDPAFYDLRTINRPEIANERTVAVWHAFVPEAGRVVATCGNHTTDELERPSPRLASYRDLRKGVYLAVREDGSTQRVPSGQITFEYLGLDGLWRPEPDTRVTSQAWRFPNEPWPPITPNLWAPFGP